MLQYSKSKQFHYHKKFHTSSHPSKEHFTSESYSSNKYHNSFNGYSNKKKYPNYYHHKHHYKPKYKNSPSLTSTSGSSENISIDFSNKENHNSIENIPSIEKKMSMDKTETSTSSKSHGDSFDNNEDIMVEVSDEKEEQNLHMINNNKNILNKFDMVQGNSGNYCTTNDFKSSNMLNFYAPIYVPMNNNQFSCNYYKKTQNTEILSVNVKISKDKEIIFKLRRFDDLFQTVKLFCEIHQIQEELIKPIIIKALEAMNNVYKVVNCTINKDDIEMLEKLKQYQKTIKEQKVKM
jgi:hypothetical protein